MWYLLHVELIVALVTPAFYSSKKTFKGVVQFVFGLLLLAIQVAVIITLLVRLIMTSISSTESEEIKDQKKDQKN